MFSFLLPFLGTSLEKITGNTVIVINRNRHGMSKKGMFVGAEEDTKVSTDLEEMEKEN